MNAVTSRPAKPEDATALVDFVTMAGEGLPEMAWTRMAGPGESTRDVGLRRAAGGEGAFSWRNATIFEVAGRVAGGLLGYRQLDVPQEIGPDFPPVFRPLQELENLACGTWYVNILGVYPAYRGHGIGAAMLDHARVLARQTGAAGTSIIVGSTNTGAERLYRRCGYTEVARRTMRVPGWVHDGGEVILLVKDPD